MSIIGGATSSVATAGTQAAVDEKKIEEDLHDFLNLLTTQLQNQDPLEPMDANQFTQQLVQFASVEQQIYQNAHLEDLLDLATNNQFGAMVSFLDKDIEYEGNTLPLRNGQATASYTLSEPVDSVVIEVIDAAGDTVLTRPGAETAGQHTFAWDGRDGSGNILPDGNYTLSVKALDAKGSSVEVPTTITASVDSVSNVDGRFMLTIGDTAIDAEQLVAVKRRDEAIVGTAEDSPETVKDSSETAEEVSETTEEIPEATEDETSSEETNEG